jgi:hypothetical protein
MAALQLGFAEPCAMHALPAGSGSGPCLRAPCGFMLGEHCSTRPLRRAALGGRCTTRPLRRAAALLGGRCSSWALSIAAMAAASAPLAASRAASTPDAGSRASMSSADDQASLACWPACCTPSRISCKRGGKQAGVWVSQLSDWLSGSAPAAALLAGRAAPSAAHMPFGDWPAGRRPGAPGSALLPGCATRQPGC